MAEGLTLERKIELAIKASGLPPEDLEPFCDEHGLELETFTGWTTAYETGGVLGVHAMLVQWTPDRETIKGWRASLKTQLKAFRPRRLRMRTEANWITVDEIKPLTTASIVHTPVFQLRSVRENGADDRWFLYWRRAGGSWWPYARTPSFDSLEAAVQEVVTDPYSCFRLHPLR